MSLAGREHVERHVWHELRGARRELVESSRPGASPREPFTNQLACRNRPQTSREWAKVWTSSSSGQERNEYGNAYCAEVVRCAQCSSHLSSATRHCVTRCVSFVAALLVAQPTQMESKTCTCCKHECTDWKRLPAIVILRSTICPCSRAIPRCIIRPRCAFCKVSAALPCYISKAMYKSLT